MATALPNNPNQECSICFESFKTPKILSCGHSFCLECLVRYIADRNGPFPCPFCKQNVEIPRGGVDKFVTNFFLQTSTDSPRPTDISTTQPSTCFQPKHHCPNHSKKEVEYYCQTCSLGLCSKCILKDHKDHKILDLECDSTKEKLVQENSKSEQFVKSKIKDLEKRHATLSETSEKLKSFCDEACTKISEKTEKIICELKEITERIQKEISDNFDKNESKLTETRQTIMTQIKNTKTDLDRSCPTTEEQSLTLIYSLNKLQDLQKLCENMKTDIPPVTYVEWTEGSIKVCDILGSIETKPLHQSIKGSGPVSTATKPLNQPRASSGPVSTVIKPLHQSIKGSGPVSTATKPLNQPRASSGPVSTVIKPLIQSRAASVPKSTVPKPLFQSKKGNVFKCNYKDIKTGLGYYSKDRYTSIGMIWSCQVLRSGSHNRYLYFKITLQWDNPLGRSCEIKYTLTLLNKDKDNKISETKTERISTSCDGERNISIPWNTLTDPSEGFIDNRGQFLVQFEILQVLDTEYIYGRYDVKGK